MPSVSVWSKDPYKQLHVGGRFGVQEDHQPFHSLELYGWFSSNLRNILTSKSRNFFLKPLPTMQSVSVWSYDPYKQLHVVGRTFPIQEDQKKSHSLGLHGWSGDQKTHSLGLRGRYFGIFRWPLKKKNENEKKIERKYFRLNLFKLSKGARWFFRSQIQFKFRSKRMEGAIVISSRFTQRSSHPHDLA